MYNNFITRVDKVEKTDKSIMDTSVNPSPGVDEE